MQTATVPSSPSSSPIAENTKSVDALGIFCGLPEPEPGAREAARCRARTATARAGSPWSARPTTGRSTSSTRSCTWPKSWYATTAPATNRPNATMRYDAALGRDVEHRREHGEEQQRRAEVLLAHHHEDREAPREQQRPEVLRVGERAGGRCGACRCASSSRLSTRYAAKKTTSSTLAASPGWKFSGPMRTQSRAPLISRPMPGQRAGAAARRRRGAGTCSGSARACGCGARPRA